MLKVSNNKLGDYIMKVKVTNNKLQEYNQVFKVRRMNYDQVIVNYPNEKGIECFNTKDLEYIEENKIDEFLIANRQFLKIKLKRGISVAFYSALKETLEMEINGEINHINVLVDKYNVNRRGIWDKNLVILINRKIPVEINASGQNFKKNSYNIVAKTLEKNYFIELCTNEVEKLEKKITYNNLEKQGFNQAINDISHE